MVQLTACAAASSPKAKRQSASAAAFTDGKLYFAKQFPSLYLEKPEVYSSRDAIILKLHINGKVDKYGLNVNLDGDLFMVGHPVVVNPDSALAKLASDRGWQVMRFDRLGRNLALGATVGAVMLAAGLTVWLQDKE